MIRAIAHPTDFSSESHIAFAHALALALRFRCRLDILHVRRPHEDEEWAGFPAVRQTLAGWGRLDVDTPHHAIESELGVAVRKIDIRSHAAAEGLATFLTGHRPNLIVAATHHTGAISRWNSVSEEIWRHTRLPTLLFGPQARPFITEHSGVLQLKTILIPVTSEPSSRLALRTLRDFFQPLSIKSYLLHVGEAAPMGLDVDAVVHLRSGPIIQTILAAVDDVTADLIAMPRIGPRGVMETLRGSTSTEIIERARCPVLVLPG